MQNCMKLWFLHQSCSLLHFRSHFSTQNGATNARGPLLSVSTTVIPACHRATFRSERLCVKREFHRVICWPTVSFNAGFGFHASSKAVLSRKAPERQHGAVSAGTPFKETPPLCSRISCEFASIAFGLKGVGVWLATPLKIYGAAWPLTELGGWVAGSSVLSATLAGLTGSFPAVFAGGLVVEDERHPLGNLKVYRMTFSPAFLALLVFAGFALWGLRRIVRKRHLPSLHGRRTPLTSASSTPSGDNMGSNTEKTPWSKWLERVVTHWAAFLLVNAALCVASGAIAGERLRPAEPGSNLSAGPNAVPWHLYIIAALLSLLGLAWLAYTLLTPVHDPLFGSILRSLAGPYLVLAALLYATMSGWTFHPWVSLPLTRQGGYLVVLLAPLVTSAQSLTSAVRDVAVKEKAFQTLAHEVRGPIQNIRTALSSMRSGLQGRLVASPDLSAALVLLFTHGNARFLTEMLLREAHSASGLSAGTPTVLASVSGGSGPSAPLRMRPQVRGPPVSANAPVTSVDGCEHSPALRVPSRQGSVDAQSEAPSADWHLLSTGGALSSSLLPSPVAARYNSAGDAQTQIAETSGSTAVVSLAGRAASGRSVRQGATSDLISDGRESAKAAKQPDEPARSRRVSATSDVSDLQNLVVMPPEHGVGQASEDMELHPQDEETRETITSIVANPNALELVHVQQAGEKPGELLPPATAIHSHLPHAGPPATGGRGQLRGPFAGAGSRSMIEGSGRPLAQITGSEGDQHGPAGPLLRAMSGGGPGRRGGLGEGVLTGGKAPLHVVIPAGEQPPRRMHKSVTLDSFGAGKQAPTVATLGRAGPPLPDRNRTTSHGRRGGWSLAALPTPVRSNSSAGGSVLSGAEEQRLLTSARALSAAVDAIASAAAGAHPLAGRSRRSQDIPVAPRIQQHDSGFSSVSARSATSDASVLTSARVHRALSQVVRLNKWSGNSAFKAIIRDGLSRRYKTTGTTRSVFSGSVAGSVAAAGGQGLGTARSRSSGHTPLHRTPSEGSSLVDLAMRSHTARLHLLQPSLELWRSLQEADVSSGMLLDNLDAQLELARLRSGKQEIMKEVFPLGGLLDNLRTSMRQRFAEHQVVAEWAPCTPLGLCHCLWRTSRKRLQQAALNILSNAAKYGKPQDSDKGCVLIKAELSEMVLPPEAVVALRQHGTRTQQQLRAAGAGRARAPAYNEAGETVPSARATGSTPARMFSRLFSSKAPSGAAAQSDTPQGSPGMISTSSTDTGVAVSPSLGPIPPPGGAAVPSTADIVNAAFEHIHCADVPDYDGALATALSAVVAAALKGSGAGRRGAWLQRSISGGVSAGKPPPRIDGRGAQPDRGAGALLHTPELLDDSSHHTSIAQPGGAEVLFRTGRDEVVQVLRVPTGTQMVFRLSVQDFGMGMTEEEQEGVFQDFTRLHQDNQGTGLGLGVAREAMRLLQGDVWCHSKGKGHGSTFTVEVPVVLEGEVPPETSPSSDNSDSDSGTADSKSPMHAAGGSPSGDSRAYAGDATGVPIHIPMSTSSPSHGAISSSGSAVAGPAGGGVREQADHNETPPNNTPPSPSDLAADLGEMSDTSVVVQSNGIDAASSDDDEGVLGGVLVTSKVPPDPAISSGPKANDHLSTIEEQSMDGRTVATGSVRGGAADGTGGALTNVSTPSSGSAGRGGNFSHKSGNPQAFNLLSSPLHSASTGQMQLQPLTGTGNPGGTPGRGGGFGFTASMGSTNSVMRQSGSIIGYGGTDGTKSLMQRQSSSASASLGARGRGQEPPPGMARQSSSASVAPVHGAVPQAKQSRQLARGGTYGSMGSRGGSLDVPDDNLSASFHPQTLLGDVSEAQELMHRRGSSGELAAVRRGLQGGTGVKGGVKSDDPGGTPSGLVRFPSTSEFPAGATGTTFELLPGGSTHEDATESGRPVSGLSMDSNSTSERRVQQPGSPQRLAGIRSVSPRGGGRLSAAGGGGGTAVVHAKGGSDETEGGGSELDHSPDSTSVTSPTLRGLGDSKASGAGGGVPRPRLSPEVGSVVARSEAKSRCVRVLVVDDDATLLRQAKRQIRKATVFNKNSSRKYDVNVDTATDGDEAVELILRGAGGGTGAITHVTLDGNMARMGGVEATALLRQGGYGGVILGITGGDDEAQEFLAAGADDALVKPVEWADVAVVLKRCSRKRASRDQGSK